MILRKAYEQARENAIKKLLSKDTSQLFDESRLAQCSLSELEATLSDLANEHGFHQEG